MPAERLAQIFEPLYTTKPGGGRGSGCIGCRRSCGLMGVGMVESQVGHGTTFTLTLPRAVAEASRPRAGPRGSL